MHLPTHEELARDLCALEPMSADAATRTSSAILGALEHRLHRDDLLGVVMQETGTTRREAERLTRMVLEAVRTHVSAAEVNDALAELPGDVAELWSGRASDRFL